LRQALKRGMTCYERKGRNSILKSDPIAGSIAGSLGIYLCRKYKDGKFKEIAGLYGGIGDTGIGQVYSGVQKRTERDDNLDGIIRKFEEG